MTNPETEEKLRKLASVESSSADRNWTFYLSGEGEERGLADDLIDVQLFQRLGKDYKDRIFLKPPLPEICSGSYRLGQVLYPPDTNFGPFGLREDEWIKHMLITGMTGAGKTNLAFQILRELNRHGKPFLIFDWKRNYRDLVQLPEFSSAVVHTVAGRAVPFFFNPLMPPPGCDPGHWLMKLVDVIKHAYFVGDGVEYLLRDAIDRTYAICGLFSDDEASAPLFSQVRDVVSRKRLQGRMSLWKASAMRVLESLCFRHGLGPVVNVTEPFPHEQILNANVILELDALSDVDKVFLTEALILWLYEFRKTEGKRETFKHALIIEEGHHVLSEMKERTQGTETIMETCLRQIREFGEAVIVIDQEPTKLSNSIKANTYTKITFNLGNGKDALEMSSCMSLNKEEADCINQLDVGHAIVSLKGRVTDPLYVRFPRIEIAKGLVTDDDMKSDRTDRPQANIFTALRVIFLHAVFFFLRSCFFDLSFEFFSSNPVIRPIDQSPVFSTITEQVRFPFFRTRPPQGIGHHALLDLAVAANDEKLARPLFLLILAMISVSYVSFCSSY